MNLLTNLNGVISDTAMISVLDRGFLYGDSIYEVVRTYRGRLFALSEHLDRLRQSATYLYLDVPWSNAQIQAQVERTLAQASWSESYVRIVVSRGSEAAIGLDPGPELIPSLLIVVKEIEPEAVFPQTGIHLVISERLRTDKRALDPAAKTGNYLNNILAKIEAQHQGADDALLLNAAGEITESTVSNFWMVKAGLVYTPPVEVGILQGVTRHYLLKILREHQIPVQEVTLTPADLGQADEAFLSSSVRLLIPVRQIDAFTLPDCPGAMVHFLWPELLLAMEPQAVQ